MSSLTFPFRRYQIGKVYRGERNQKGRFREFYQADIDIIGDTKLSIINDAEIPSIIYSTFRELGFDKFKIHINNRKILNGFFEALQLENKADILRVIDKIDKVGVEIIKAELQEMLGQEDQVDKILSFITLTGTNAETAAKLENLELDNEEFKEGVKELSTVVDYIALFGVPESNFVIDLKIARGLDYYTGTVYETILDDYPSIGSVCSGGRYENLASFYTDKKLPGVGISIGLTRLFYQLREAGIIKGTSSTLTKVLVIPFEGYEMEAVKAANELRANNIITEVFSEEMKMGKKLGYANKLGIPYVIMIGEDESATGQLTLKNMLEGQQQRLTIQEIITQFK
jgi:histidyl-tRNA synthetase